MDRLECPLCHNQYDDSKHHARTLPCAHYFCEDCLDQVIRSPSPHCPTCRTYISTHSVKMLPPNILVDGLLHKKKAGLHSVCFEEKEIKVNAGSCEKHKKCQLYFTCKKHNMKICRECQHPPSQSETISRDDGLEETKKMTISNLETHKLNREKNISDLQNIISDTESKIAKLQKELSKNEQVLKKANDAIQNCMENKKKIEKTQQELSSSITINQINYSFQEAEYIAKVSNSIEISHEKLIKLATNCQVSVRFENIIDKENLK